MVTGQSHTLGLVVADIENPFFARLTRGFADVAGQSGFDVIVLNTDEEITAEASALRVLLQRRVDGVGVAPASVTQVGHLREVVDSGVPLVLLDRRIPRLGVDVVGIDNRAAAFAAVTHLVEHGHSRIAMVSGGAGDQGANPAAHILTTGQDRISGYRDALSAANLGTGERYLRITSFRQDAAREVAVDLLSRAARPTAIFCSDSVLTLGVLHAVQAIGASIPSDVSVVGFDDADWMNVVCPPLSVVDQPAYDIGALAASRLVARVEGSTARAQYLRLPTTFISRGSVGPPSSRPLVAARSGEATLAESLMAT
jgi:LacI family transcriptional regulator